MTFTVCVCQMEPVLMFFTVSLLLFYWLISIVVCFFSGFRWHYFDFVVSTIAVFFPQHNFVCTVCSSQLCLCMNLYRKWHVGSFQGQNVRSYSSLCSLCKLILLQLKHWHMRYRHGMIRWCSVCKTWHFQIDFGMKLICYSDVGSEIWLVIEYIIPRKKMQDAVTKQTGLSRNFWQINAGLIDEKIWLKTVFVII